MNEKQICSGCGKPRVIQNKEHNLCRECNTQRLACDGLHARYNGLPIAEINKLRKEADSTVEGLKHPTVVSKVGIGENGSIILENSVPEENERIPLAQEKPEVVKNQWSEADYQSLGAKIAEMLYKAQAIKPKQTVKFRCPECQAPLAPAQPFCSKCGSEMEWVQ
jgi:DNA-binding transcriptional MerR regulator